MLISIALLVGVFAASFLSAELGSVRSRSEERGYQRYAMGERQVGQYEAANAPIQSTDTHYLHPHRARPGSSPLVRETSALSRTQ